jgi:hypothetical protein
LELSWASSRRRRRRQHGACIITERGASGACARTCDKLGRDGPGGTRASLRVDAETSIVRKTEEGIQGGGNCGREGSSSGKTSTGSTKQHQHQPPRAMQTASSAIFHLLAGNTTGTRLGKGPPPAALFLRPADETRASGAGRLSPWGKLRRVCLLALALRLHLLFMLLPGGQPSGQYHIQYLADCSRCLGHVILWGANPQTGELVDGSAEGLGGTKGSAG